MERTQFDDFLRGCVADPVDAFEFFDRGGV
jgi:hypothetical protein